MPPSLALTLALTRTVLPSLMPRICILFTLPMPSMCALHVPSAASARRLRRFRTVHAIPSNHPELPSLPPFGTVCALFTLYTTSLPFLSPPHAVLAAVWRCTAPRPDTLPPLHTHPLLLPRVLVPHADLSCCPAALARLTAAPTCLRPPSLVPSSPARALVPRLRRLVPTAATLTRPSEAPSCPTDAASRSCQPQPCRRAPGPLRTVTCPHAAAEVCWDRCHALPLCRDHVPSPPRHAQQRRSSVVRDPTPTPCWPPCRYCVSPWRHPAPERQPRILALPSLMAMPPSHAPLVPFRGS
ncbi:hypothetical protein DENSPDRAFT_886221 [Dentipellis sp. KUC8613]|nr:hypothetical protein DENSPDRAFT_886221 [Dentipellis sp. KUC8613]